MELFPDNIPGSSTARRYYINTSDKYVASRTVLLNGSILAGSIDSKRCFRSGLYLVEKRVQARESIEPRVEHNSFEAGSSPCHKAQP
jgi:hypothetical protein